jgi:hypothetical protein
LTVDGVSRRGQRCCSPAQPTPTGAELSRLLNPPSVPLPPRPSRARAGLRRPFSPVKQSSGGQQYADRCGSADRSTRDSVLMFGCSVWCDRGLGRHPSGSVNDTGARLDTGAAHGRAVSLTALPRRLNVQRVLDRPQPRLRHGLAARRQLEVPRLPLLDAPQTGAISVLNVSPSSLRCRTCTTRARYGGQRRQSQHAAVTNRRPERHLVVRERDTAPSSSLAFGRFARAASTAGLLPGSSRNARDRGHPVATAGARCAVEPAVQDAPAPGYSPSFEDTRWREKLAEVPPGKVRLAVQRDAAGGVELEHPDDR